jgi:hypothetical protein
MLRGARRFRDEIHNKTAGLPFNQNKRYIRFANPPHSTLHKKPETIVTQGRVLSL